MGSENAGRRVLEAVAKALDEAKDMRSKSTNTNTTAYLFEDDARALLALVLERK